MLTEAIRLLEQANNYSIRLQMGEDWCVSVDAILAAHSAGAQEPEAWLTPGNDLYLENPGYDDWTPLYTHPQPMPQTDTMRDVLDHETALRGCRILSNIVSAYNAKNRGKRVIYLIGVAKSWFAEIERL